MKKKSKFPILFWSILVILGIALSIYSDFTNTGILFCTTWAMIMWNGENK